MADKTSGNGDKPSQGSGKSNRPHATLDLKATEIKVTRIAEPKSPERAGHDPVPRPAPASSYGDANAKPDKSSGQSAYSGHQKVGAAPASSKASSSSSTSGATGRTTTATSDATDKVIVKKRGGFFSHLAASLVGGLVALAGAGAVERVFDIDVPFVSAQPDVATTQSSEMAQRLSSLEARLANVSENAATAGVAPIEDSRIAALEDAVKKIPSLAEAQSRLAADTKAALAAAASDSGAPEQLTRLASVEEKLNALEQVGANDPNASRVAQVAALTGKVSDLETALATQLTELRRSVSADVEARMQSALASSEAAKAGTQRIDRDIATLKADGVRTEEQINTVSKEVAAVTEAAKRVEQEVATVQSGLNTLQSEVAKPADIDAVISPLKERLAAVDTSLAALQASEVERKANAARVVQAIELQHLKRAVDSGRPFADALAAVQANADANVDLSALETFKNDGVLTLVQLQSAFSPAANAALDSTREAADGSVFDQLIAGAKSIVRVRRTDHAPDDTSAEAIIGRMEVALNEGRLSDVLKAANALPEKAQASLKPFLDKVSARVEVDAALADLDQKLKAALGAPSEPNAAPPPPPASVTQ